MHVHGEAYCLQLASTQLHKVAATNQTLDVLFPNSHSLSRSLVVLVSLRFKVSIAPDERERRQRLCHSTVVVGGDIVLEWKHRTFCRVARSPHRISTWLCTVVGRSGTRSLVQLYWLLRHPCLFPLRSAPDSKCSGSVRGDPAVLGNPIGWDSWERTCTPPTGECALTLSSQF